MKWIHSRWLLILLLWLASWPGLARAEAPVILVFGDSLSAGYGIPVEQGWVSLLQRRLKERGFAHQVVNASISGDTTGGGLSRLPAALERHRPALVILELGANDGLRGQPPMAMANNLGRMIELAQQAGARVLLDLDSTSDYVKELVYSFAPARFFLSTPDNTASTEALSAYLTEQGITQLICLDETSALAEVATPLAGEDGFYAYTLYDVLDDQGTLSLSEH